MESHVQRSRRHREWRRRPFDTCLESWIQVTPAEAVNGCAPQRELVSLSAAWEDKPDLAGGNSGTAMFGATMRIRSETNQGAVIC